MRGLRRGGGGGWEGSISCMGMGLRDWYVGAEGFPAAKDMYDTLISPIKQRLFLFWYCPMFCTLSQKTGVGKLNTSPSPDECT